jgi:hypothetical protein
MLVQHLSCSEKVPMSGSDSKLFRSWQDIAAELAKEDRTDKIIELSEELEHALQHRDNRRRDGSVS